MEEFEKLDYRIMGLAYASQNELGRFCDECAYEADLKARLKADGFNSVETQVPLTVTHCDFSKNYRLDLVADNAIYELKTDNAFVGEHETQLFNYLFLLGQPRGKLLNFRPLKVQGKLIATSLTPDIRRRFITIKDRWTDFTSNCVLLRQRLGDLLEDWGAFLDLALYQEALVHLLGNSSEVEQRVSLQRNGLNLGSQRLLMLGVDIAFRITAYTDNQNHVESHLNRLLALTHLKAIQWINFNHGKIEFTTIKK